MIKRTLANIFSVLAIIAVLALKPALLISGQTVEKRTYNQQRVRAEQLDAGDRLFIRIFKYPGKLEIWKKHQDQFYRLFKTYPICNFSGFLGPKIREGDRQSPEGFYFITNNSLNPHSKYHLSINLGYPNSHDSFHNRTGGNIMIHGGCSSLGCFAMGDTQVGEIYSLTAQALSNGQQRINVHIFPFALEKDTLLKFRSSPWFVFWQQLQPFYHYFLQTKKVPIVNIHNGKYTFTSTTNAELNELTQRYEQ